MTGWKLDYILDSISLDQAMMIHDYGFEFEETKSIILVNKIAECFFGVKGKSKTRKIEPDKLPPKYDELKAMFGDRVKLITKEKEVK